MIDLKNLSVFDIAYGPVSALILQLFPVIPTFFVHLGTAETSCQLISKYFSLPSDEFKSNIPSLLALFWVPSNVWEKWITPWCSWGREAEQRTATDYKVQYKPKRDLGDNQRLSHNHIVPTLSFYTCCYKNMDNHTLNVACWSTALKGLIARNARHLLLSLFERSARWRTDKSI